MRLSTKTVAYLGLLSALAIVLMFFPHFPVLSSAPFLKIDFSDVPALLASVTISPFCGVIVELCKNLIHLAFSDTGLVGELSNFIVGSVFALSAGFLSKCLFPNMLMKKKLIIVLVFASLLQVTGAMLSNYFVIAPMYFGADNAKIAEFVMYSALPFNIIKDILQAVTFYIVYRAVYPFVKKNMYLFK